MIRDDHELLSALLDREPVDPDALARVLESGHGRALLVDFVRVRHTLHAPPRDAQRHHPVRPLAEPLPWERLSGHFVARREALRVVGRAAAVALLVAGGGIGGAWLAAQRNDGERAPEPSRVVRLTPVATPDERGLR